MENEDEKWQKEKLKSPDAQNTYKMVFLGRGASIAYYIESLGRNFNHTESVLIGTPQPFETERGPGFVVHPEHMITPKRQFSETTEIDDKWVDRRDFSQWVKETLEASKIKSHEEQVTDVEESGRFYRIIYGKGQAIYAKEVIVGIGSGKHAIRGLKEHQVARKDEEVKIKGIMDMDLFTRNADTLVQAHERKDAVIIIAGGVGVVSSAFDALNKGFKVKWIPGANGAEIFPGEVPYAVSLPYFRALLKLEKDINQIKLYEQIIKNLEESMELDALYEVQDQTKFKDVAENFKTKEVDGVYLAYVESAEKSGNSVKVKLTSGEEIDGDYLVYGMGQDLSTFKVLDKQILQSLESDSDLNLRFRPKKENGTDFTTLGLKTRDDPTGRSLKIIGAAAYRMVLDINAQRAREDASLSDTIPLNMNNVIAGLPATVPLNDVLAAIRTQVEATTNFMPYDINKRANFLADDRTMLAVHISAKYPAIADYQSPISARGKETDAVPSGSLVGILAEMIVQSRRQKGMKMKTGGLSLDGPDVLPIPPHGREFQENWDKALTRLEEYLQQNKKEG